jgi:hypothetical protein
MGNTAQTLEHGIRIYSDIVQISDDAETIKDAFSRVLEINSDIDALYKSQSLDANEVSYLRDIVEKEVRDMAVILRSCS